MEDRNSVSSLIAIGVIVIGIFVAWVFLGPGDVLINQLWGAVTSWSTDAANWYQLKLEGSTKLLAPLITIISGTYAIVKAYKYAEARLHYRLHDFLKREEARLNGARSKLRMTIDRPGVKRDFVEPRYLEDNLRSAVRELGWGSYFLPPQLGFVEYQLATAISQLERQTTMNAERQRYLCRQLATAHLLKGALWVSEASQSAVDAQGERVALTNAASHFAEALQIDADDEECLEYLGHVYARLGQTDEAAAILDKLLKLTAEQEKSLTRARALRSYARIEMEDSRNGVAVRHLRKALHVLPNLFGADRIEEAEMNEALADCQNRLGYNTQARAHWEVAQALYGTVRNAEAKERGELVAKKLKELNPPPMQLN